jgi:ATP-dependent Zn protease
VQYIPQQQTVQYVPQQQTVKYVSTTNSQGASAANALSSNTNTTTSSANRVVASNTGNYVNYDVNNNPMGATAYQYNSTGQVVTTPVVDSNGVAALSVKGSGSFMPSSVFQWILLILIILAIIVIARMIARKSQTNDPHAVPVH